ncbi:MAG: transglutaminaseTgpA domain-containing protein [Pseudonocardiaceae bacterium]
MRQFPQQTTGTAVNWFTARVLPPVVAGLAVTLAATSLIGVLTGPRWWGSVVLATSTVVAAGVALRWLRMPPMVVATGQLTALVGLVTAVFTSSVLPGPAAAAQLSASLARAAQQIRIGVPPVAESTELLFLVVAAVGLVAVVVDTLAISAAAPASSGLVLLCVVTVPAAASDRLLPWWSFALSALGFTLLLAVDSQRRQLAWGEPTGPGKHLGAALAAVTVTAGAMVVALLVGATVTAVGTIRATGNGGRTDQTVSGIGLSPFTSLRGQLSTGETVALFRVRGLGQQAYLRALTLSRFTTAVGWQQGPRDHAIPAGDENSERLPLPAGVVTPIAGATVRVQIEPINYVDNWLPSFGYPLSLAGIGPDWRYDPDAITIFSNRRQRAQPYTELGVLPQPDAQLLRAAGPASGAPFTTIDPRYLDTGEVDQRVTQLANQVTAGAPTAFDTTVALNQWFRQPSNGFTYDLRTVSGNSGNDLLDFLLTGHRGYCEQFASAMAIMLRTLHVPARVAVGFTPGSVDGSTQVITTQDAHAWVEAWFPGAGWLPFDPTPLSGERTVTPGYVADGATPPNGGTAPTRPPVTATPAPDAATTAPPPLRAGDPKIDPSVNDRNTDINSGGDTWIGLPLIGVLVLGVLAGFTPLGVREIRRRRRLHLIGAGGPQAVSAAWEEVLAESADRGVVPPTGETVRATAQRLARKHALDKPGQAGLRALVTAVERSWYAKGSHHNAAYPSSPGTEELCTAVDAVRASMARCAPQTRMTRLLPRSVFSRLKAHSER